MKSIPLLLCVLAMLTMLAVPASLAEETAQNRTPTPGLEKQVRSLHGPDRLAVLMELSDRYWNQDPDKSFTYAREAQTLALEMFGVTMEQIKGKSYLDFSPPLQPDGRESAVAGAEYRERAFKGESFRFNWQYVDKNGAPLEAAVSLTPITFGKDTIIQVIAHDISDRVRLQEERIKAAKLETTSQLAGGIAHDFNNLLTIILGNLDMAIDDAPKESEIKPLLQEVEKAAQKSKDLLIPKCNSG